MATKRKDKLQKQRREKRVRNKIKLVSTKPRISIFRSLKHTYAQIIDDAAQKTVAACSTAEFPAKGSKKEQAHQVGMELAKRAKEKGIHEAVLDRGRFLYHGRVKEFTEGLREGGFKI